MKSYLFHTAIQICPSRHGKQLDMTHLLTLSRVQRLEKNDHESYPKTFHIFSFLNLKLHGWACINHNPWALLDSQHLCFALESLTAMHIFESQSAVWSSPGGLRGFHQSSPGRWSLVESGHGYDALCLWLHVDPPNQSAVAAISNMEMLTGISVDSYNEENNTMRFWMIDPHT